MFKSKQFVNFVLATVAMLAINSRASAQNLTAKANSVQPQPVSAVVESDRVRDGLAGPVRRVRTEVAKLSNVSGKIVEDKRVVLEVTAYDIKGAKTENQYFPVAGSTLTGKEVYKYDEKGNISEMTLQSDDGSLLSKEVYKYDYDLVGNWTRMTTSVAVIEGGKVTFEPTEVTYRSIMYYLDENMLKMAQSTSPSSNGIIGSATTPSKTGATDAKPQPVASLESKPPQPSSGAPSKPAANQQGTKSTGTLPPRGAAVDRSITINPAEFRIANADAGSSKGSVVAIDSEAPPAPKPKPPLMKPVSGGVLNGSAISLPPPIYPETARRLRIGGMVTVQVVLDESGKVISAAVTDGPQILREAAVQAALKAKFSPTKLSGQPVKVTGTINYKFTLSQ
jgi:TonB family protein